jgi:hypothetical protein
MYYSSFHAKCQEILKVFRPLSLFFEGIPPHNAAQNSITRENPQKSYRINLLFAPKYGMVYADFRQKF